MGELGCGLDKILKRRMCPEQLLLLWLFGFHGYYAYYGCYGYYGYLVLNEWLGGWM